MIIPIVKYSSASLPKYDYTGQAPLFFKDNQGNWEMVFTGNCTVTFSRLITNVDIFAVGGGAQGGAGDGYYVNSENAYAKAGDGGKGGGCVTRTGVDLNVGTTYPVTIGGSSVSTSAFGVTAPAGQGSNGGAGAVSSCRPSGSGGHYSTASVAGVGGVLAFGTGGTQYENGTPIYFGAGGGGGGAKASYESLVSASDGGSTGGGAGSASGNGSNGTPNTGGGGGGGARLESGGAFKPGDGGSGIVIIRNARSST